MKALAAIVAVSVLSGCAVMGAGSGAGTEAKNMRLVGYSDLQGRSAFQPVIVNQSGRWIAYVGHHGGSAANALTGRSEPNGTSILDVTDPARPRYLHHLPTASNAEMAGGEGSGAQMVQICAGRDLPKADRSKVYMLRTDGSRAHELWDVTTPSGRRSSPPWSAISRPPTASGGNATRASRTWSRVCPTGACCA